MSFIEWIGTGAKYDVVYREDEFRFSLGDGATGVVHADVSPVSEVPDYELSDRKDRDLTEAQRRDFATRSVLSLVLP